MPGKLQQAIALIKAGEKQQGKRLLAEVLIQDPGQEVAWLLMADVVEYDEHRRYCLEQVLRLNPSNQYAQNSLVALERDDRSQGPSELSSTASAALPESGVGTERSDTPPAPGAKVDNGAFVQAARSNRERESTRRKGPIVLVVAISLVGGLALFLLNGPLVLDFALDPRARLLDAPDIVPNLLLMALGAALTVAGLVGIWWALGPSTQRSHMSRQQPGAGRPRKRSMDDPLDAGIWLDTSHDGEQESGLRLL